MFQWLCHRDHTNNGVGDDELLWGIDGHSIEEEVSLEDANGKKAT